MKRQLRSAYSLLIFFLLAGFLAEAQTKQDTVINQQIDATSGNYLTKKVANPVLHEMLGNRVTDYGDRTLLDEIITFSGVKVKFGNSAEIGPLSGSDTLTAPDADPLNFRFDLLVVNRNGTTEIITGTPGLQGIDPPYDVANQIPVYRVLVNDRGVGTVTPVTYATLTEVRDGILDNVALSPSTYITVTQEMIDEALAGLMLGAGHALKNNATTLTQRPTLQVLSNSTVMRDSSATTSSLLDLRDYVGRFGTVGDYTLNGDYVVRSTGYYNVYSLNGTTYSLIGIDYTHGSIVSRKSYSSNNLLAELLLDNQNLDGVNGNVVARFGTINQTTQVSHAQVYAYQFPLTSKLLFSGKNAVGQPAWRGAEYPAHYLSYATAAADTTNDLKIPDVRLVKEAIAAGGGVDTTVLATRAHVLQNYIPYSGTTKNITGDFAVYDGFFLDRNGGGSGRSYLSIYNQEVSLHSLDNVAFGATLAVNPHFVNVDAASGLIGSAYYPTANPLSFIQKFYADSLFATAGGGSGGDADSLGGVPPSGYERALTQQAHVSGSTITIANGTGTIWLIVNPASLLAVLTITMPATPLDNQLVEISFGGTVTTSTVVTALTISPNTSQALLQATTPTTAEAGEIISYRWKSAVSKWYRVN